MPMHRMNTPLRCGRKEPIAVGVVDALDEIDPMEIDDLIAIGAIEITDDGEPSGASTPIGKPLAKMNKAELHAIGAEEDVTFAPDATNAAMVTAIEAKRAEAGK